MNRLNRSVLVLCLGAAIGLAALPAAAGDKDKNWNRGCADAKAGTYDRSRHGEAYEKGWQACKKQAPTSTQEDDDYSRGCDDAKAGTYDRAHPTPAYERGWQSCKQNNSDDDAANEGANRQKEWDRGCADAKANSYDRARHNADYEAGWQACKAN